MENASVWQEVAQQAERRESVGGEEVFVRLKNDGDRIVGVFCGNPHSYERVWVDSRSALYDPAIHVDLQPRLEVALNFYVPSLKRMMVISGGPRWFRQVAQLRDKYGLDQWSFEVVRRGKPGDMQTTYTFLPEERITPELKKQIDETPLHDLETAIK